MSIDVKKNHHSSVLRQTPSGFRNIVLALLTVLSILPSVAQAWWNQEWSYRKEIMIDASAKAADLKSDVDNVSVLIRLHEGVFKFSDASTDGSDLRFVLDDDKTPLKFHIEKFDSVFSLAFVWVQIPKLKAGEVQKIWMYYGSGKGVSGSESRETYDPDQVLVYHFGERGSPVADSTGYANTSRSIAELVEGGLIGSAAKFDGQSAVLVPDSPSLSFPDAAPFTWSAWIRPSTPNEDAVLFSRRSAQGAMAIRLVKGAPQVTVTNASGVAASSAATQPLGDKAWHHLAVTGGARLTLYIDGEPGPLLEAPQPAISGVASLGADTGELPNAPVSGFIGDIDELKIARINRDPAAIRLEVVNQGSSDKLIGFGVDERLSSWSSGYFGIILKSVTLDGWVIIGILFVMAVLSWGVMVRKTRQINRVIGGNRAFQSLFRSVGGDFNALDHLIAGTAVAAGPELTEPQRMSIQRAPLFHMFSVGLDELRDRLTHDRHGRQRNYLSPQSITAIRASLDSSLVEEQQALNKRMVVLTIAISGGPFLGLLGTVVGVMITFAAIAASGDVNVNAIAPGISAALVATVAGLLVAIPALFGYNYLTIQIKDASTSMQVFLDAFVARMAENYDDPGKGLGMLDMVGD